MLFRSWHLEDIDCKLQRCFDYFNFGFIFSFGQYVNLYTKWSTLAYQNAGVKKYALATVR